MRTVGRKRTVLAGVFAVLLASAAIAVLLKASAGKDDSLETVRIGAVTGFASGLVYVADEKGFFKGRGVNVAIDAFDTGLMAVDALVSDQVDVTTAAEFVLVQRSFGNDHLRTFAQIANLNPIEMVARKDRGIEKLSDLKGKKIGVTMGSSSEFYLDGFLKRNNISKSSVEIVNLGPKAIESSLYNGSVDAVVGWGLHVTKIKERLGENAAGWPVQGRDDYYFLMVTTDQFLRRSPATAEKMVRALIDAEQFAVNYPDEARRIIELKVMPWQENIPPDWSKFRLAVRLDQALLTLMEAEAHWMIRNNLTPKREMPNYLDMVYLNGLEAVRPEAVGIIH
jgi:NitT/TauT family transport system substrate-binding protein